MVFAVLFLRHGRKQIGEWREFLDSAHGNDNLDGELLGIVFERMVKCESSDFSDVCHWYFNDFVVNCSRGHR